MLGICLEYVTISGVSGVFDYSPIIVKAFYFKPCKIGLKWLKPFVGLGLR